MGGQEGWGQRAVDDNWWRVEWSAEGVGLLGLPDSLGLKQERGNQKTESGPLGVFSSVVVVLLLASCGHLSR